uniref:Oxaloacetate tautomerase FAHD1, mitochondrial n=1 Tax=Maylandia zebra TaxID=106582 RepID=A0A3P9DHQ0_9CICH
MLSHFKSHVCVKAPSLKALTDIYVTSCALFGDHSISQTSWYGLCGNLGKYSEDADSLRDSVKVPLDVCHVCPIKVKKEKTHIGMTCSRNSSRFSTMTARNISRFWEWGRKIICVGRNYADHAKELKNAIPKEPVLFLKPPTAYVREVELGVVIGKGGTAIPQSAAMEHVAGYALCLDMTARDIQDECKSKGLPWTMAKAFNTSCPVSEFIPKERIPDPAKVSLWLKVNNQLRQSGCTSQMIFSVPYLISYISDFITLEEGDLILTGTLKESPPLKKKKYICQIKHVELPTVAPPVNKGAAESNIRFVTVGV